MITDENLTVKEILEQYGRGLSVGDVIYFLLHEYKHIDCKTCEGSEKVNVFLNDDEFTIDCPVCLGDGYRTYKHYDAHEGTITSINITLGDFKSHKFYNSHIASPIEFKVSSIPINENEFFLTKEECLAKADELNKKEMEDAILD